MGSLGAPPTSPHPPLSPPAMRGHLRAHQEDVHQVSTAGPWGGPWDACSWGGSQQLGGVPLPPPQAPHPSAGPCAAPSTRMSSGAPSASTSSAPRRKWGWDGGVVRGGPFCVSPPQGHGAVSFPSSLPESEAGADADGFDVAESQALMSRLQWDGASDISPSDSASSKASECGGGLFFTGGATQTPSGGAQPPYRAHDPAPGAQWGRTQLQILGWGLLWLLLCSGGAPFLFRDPPF